MSKVRIVDLFAGTGAFSFSFESNSKFKSVYANDFDKNSQKIYQANFPQTNFHLGDISVVKPKDIPIHDILCGGFPCQPFSVAGLKKGFDDTRSNVFWKIIEIIKYHKPKVILLENVKNLSSHEKGTTFRTIKDSLEKEGYQLKYQVLDTSKYSEIPHHRERIYIVGFLDKSTYDKFNFNFPKIQNKLITNYLEANVDSSFYYSDKYKIYSRLKKEVTKNINTNTLYQYRRYYIRENKNGCCPTLTANMGTGGHNVPILLDNIGIRKLTPRECFNLQGFPPHYVLPQNISNSGLYKLAGNAVSIPIVNLLVDTLANIL